VGKHFAELGGPIFEHLVIGATIADLIAEGYLVDVDIFAPSEPDMAKVRSSRGIDGLLDYNQSDLEDATDKPELVGDIISHWRKLATDKQTVVFATSIAHSKHIVEQFRSAGVSAEHIDYWADDDERAAILGRFAAGETTVLSNVALLSEGWDCPACEVMILARPTRSLIRFIQMVGRVLRPAPGKSLQVPPARAEALLRGYLNTWGMYGLMLSDRAFFGDKQPEMRTDQMPVVRRFYSQEPPQHTKFESQFYDMLGEAKRLQGTLRELDRQGRPDIADQKEQGLLAGEAKPLERANKNLQGINAEMRDVRRAADLTPGEKRQRLDSLTVERNQLLKDAVLAAKEAQGNR